jgi:dsRNA-specific ribonuclease
MVALVNRARDEEYEEVADTAERLVEEIARETRKGKFTFAALEEVEGEHERLVRWVARVVARDVCGALGRADAQAKLAAAEQALEVFAEEVQRREGAHLAAGEGATGR